METSYDTECSAYHLSYWLIQTLDSIVELYVESLLYPLLDYLLKIINKDQNQPKSRTNNRNLWVWNFAIYSFLFNHDVIVSSSLVKHDFVTILRIQIMLVIPTLLWLAAGRILFPIILITSVLFGEWESFRQKNEGDRDGTFATEEKQKEFCSSDDEKPDKTILPLSNDIGSESDFEVVTMTKNDLPQRCIDSWKTETDNVFRKEFFRAMSHKAFFIPLWIHLLSEPKSELWHHLCLVWLTVSDFTSGIAACQAYLTALPSIPEEEDNGENLAWDQILLILKMIGTVLWLLPPTALFRPLGLFLLLWLACPLAHYSHYRNQKKKHGVMYVSCDTNVLDYRLIRLWMQTKAMGTKLIVGLVDNTTQNNEDRRKKNGNQTDIMTKNICSIPCVDQVIIGAPMKVDLLFLEQNGIDCVVGSDVTDQVIRAGKCWILEEVDHFQTRARQLKIPTSASEPSLRNET